jgi:hypothetical protein
VQYGSLDAIRTDELSSLSKRWLGNRTIRGDRELVPRKVSRSRPNATPRPVKDVKYSFKSGIGCSPIAVELRVELQLRLGNAW